MSPIQLTLLAAGGLALLLTGPAEGAKKHGDRLQAGRTVRAAAAPAHRAAAARPPMVVFGERVIGTDPDVRIRHELLRDLGAVFGGND
jgi:hypothetical protein